MKPHSHCAADGAPQAFDALVGDGLAVAADGAVGECGAVADDEGVVCASLMSMSSPWQ